VIALQISNVMKNFKSAIARYFVTSGGAFCAGTHFARYPAYGTGHQLVGGSIPKPLAYH
jgi:hypothetical protein